MALFHKYDVLTTIRGDSLPGYQVVVRDPDSGAVVPIFSDKNGTPIVAVSGIVNTALTDTAGNYSLFVTEGTYDLQYFAPDGLMIGQTKQVPMQNGTPGVGGPAGPSSNTRIDLAVLKAAAITDLTSLYDGSPWYWKTTDAPYAADDVNIVKADSTALTVGAWVRQEADGVNYDGRSVAIKLAEIVSVKDAQFAGGAKGNGIADDTAAIQAAINAVSGSRGEVRFPVGTYKITAPLSITAAVKLLGAGKGASILSYSGNITLLDCNLDPSDYGLQLQDFRIKHTGAAPTAGDAIRWRNVFGARIQNIVVQSAYNAFHQSTSGLSTIDGFFPISTVNTAMLFDGGGNYDTYVSNFILAGATTCIKLVDQCDELIFVDGICSSATTALYTDATTFGVNACPDFCRFARVSFDSCQNGLDLANCADFVFDACFISCRPNAGAVIGSRGPTRNIQFGFTTFQTNGTSGVDLWPNAKFTDFFGCKFQCNGNAAANTYHGLLIRDTTTDVNIIGCQGDNLWGSGTQNFDVYISGASCDRINIIGGNYRVGKLVNSSTQGAVKIIGVSGYESELKGSVTYDPPSISDGAGGTTALTVSGAALGDFVTGLSFSNDLQSITLTAWVSSPNTVSVRFQNETGAAVDLGSGTLRVRVSKAT